MPRNQNGQYFLPDGNPVTPGELITSDWANTTLDDVAAALTNSLDRSGAGGMKAPLRLVDGTAVSPSVGFSSETATGLFLKSAGVIGVAVMGNEVAEITKNGITMIDKTSIVLPNAPSDDNQAANKKYVDDAIGNVPKGDFVQQTSITGAAKMPHGSTSEAPTGEVGMMRVDSELNLPVWFNPVTAKWEPLGNGGDAKNYYATLVLVGGGGGGDLGGGGGGGVQVIPVLITASETYAVEIGFGGAVRARGGDSKFGKYRSLGGGKAGVAGADGVDGGSGGGGNPVGYGGKGTDGQGHAGGYGYEYNGQNGAGGGGGAGFPGDNGNNPGPGKGGDGIKVTIAGVDEWFGGGGGAAAGNANPGAGAGGKGGGGAGDKPGQNGTGGGGGGNAAGGKGIAILFYEGSQRGLGGEYTFQNGYSVHRFKDTGSYRASKPTQVDIEVLVGGGGSSGTPLGGDSGGCVVVAQQTLTMDKPYSAAVGGIGGTSTFNSVNATGGRIGGGRDGGSNDRYGGGGSDHWGWDESTDTNANGGGAGAAAGGGSGYIQDVVGQHQPTGGSGGNGFFWALNGQYYGGGWGGGTNAPPGVTQNGGAMGNGWNNYCGGRRGGVIIVSYISNDAFFAGGDITFAGGRVFHTFGTSGTLVPL